MIESIVSLSDRIAWRDLPIAFGPWQTVWAWHRRLAGDGTWDRIHARLLAAAGKVDWSVSVDSTTARAHQHGDERHPQREGCVELQESGPRAV